MSLHSDRVLAIRLRSRKLIAESDDLIRGSERLIERSRDLCSPFREFRRERPLAIMVPVELAA